MTPDNVRWKTIFPNKETEMNKATEALKLAEKALSGDYDVHPDEALAAIRAALAEPVKQKPVAYIRKDQLQRAMKYPCLCEVSPEPRSDRVEIYAAPVDVKAIRAEAFKEAAKVVAAVWGYVKAEPVKQEPVGVVESNEEWGVAGVLIEGLPIGTKLYAAPVRPQWIDLTDDEIREVLIKFNRGSAKFDPLEDFRAVIAAFKEKNK